MFSFQVIISVGIGTVLQPSIFDSIIIMKKLPYLPDLLPSGGAMYDVAVENFMVHEVKYIYDGISYHDLNEILQQDKSLRSLPLVDNQDNMILLGSVQRSELKAMINKHIGSLLLQQRFDIAKISVPQVANEGWKLRQDGDEKMTKGKNKKGWRGRRSDAQVCSMISRMSTNSGKSPTTKCCRLRRRKI